MVAHYNNTGHNVAMNVKSTMVWCYDCDDEVQSSSTDGIRKLLVEKFSKPPAVSKPKLSSNRSSSTVKGTRGIVNIGNTCFLAASMQCLSNTVPLQKLLRHCPPYSPSELEQSLTPQQKLVIAVRNFFIAQWGDPHKKGSVMITGPAVSPDEILSSVQRLNSLFHGYQQHDSQEFLRFLLNTMHEELRQKLDISSSEEVSIVSEVFRGKTCSTVTCLRCNKESKCIEPFYDISLPIPNEPFTIEMRENILKSNSTVSSNNPPMSTSSWLWSRTKNILGLSSEPRVSITDCFIQFMKTEKLAGADAYFCNHCKTKTECLKRMSIISFPEVLVVHLKRFRHDWGSSKLTKLVSFPVSSDLDLSGFSEEDSHSAYRLSGFVQHMGSIGSGHYVAYCRQKTNGQWYLFDDSRVSLVTNISQIEQGEAYVLFFQRVSDPSVIEERRIIKQNICENNKAAIIPRQWISEVKSMSRVPSLKCSKLVVCPHKRPSTSCANHAAALFVHVTSEYAKRVIFKFGNDGYLLPESLDKCSECSQFIAAYNSRLQVEHKLITKLDTKNIVPGQKWFFIDAAWVTAWRMYLRHGSIQDSNKASGPGPVTCKELVSKLTKGNKEEISKLRITSDFVAVNPNVWNVFTHCHGTDGVKVIGDSLDVIEAEIDKSPIEHNFPEQFITREEWDQLSHKFVDIDRGH